MDTLDAAAKFQRTSAGTMSVASLNILGGAVNISTAIDDVMKQGSALQASLEGVNRGLLQNHVETCVMHAVKEGRTTEIVDELLETIRYTPAVTGPTKETGND